MPTITTDQAFGNHFFRDTSDCLYISDVIPITNSHDALKTVRFCHRPPIRAYRRGNKPRMFPDY